MLNQTPTDQVLFEAAFHSASIGIALVGLDGSWRRVNRAVCQIVGYSEDELLKTTFQKITHPDDLAPDLALVDKLLRNEIGSYELEKRYFHKSGSIVWIQLSVALARDASGDPLVFVAQIQNITPRKLAEQKLAETLTEKETLLAAFQASHEESVRLREGLLTMCAWTKSVKHNGQWMSVDEFLQKHMKMRVTHGISDEAAKVILDELRPTDIRSSEFLIEV